MTKFMQDISQIENVKDIDILNWNVERQDLITAKNIEAKRHSAIVRIDTQDILGIVGKKWEPYQPVEGLTELQGLKDKGILTFEKAGIVDGGRMIFATGRLSESEVVKGDPIRNNIFFKTGFDGSNSTAFFPSRVRPSCWNCVSLAFRLARTEKAGFTIRHTKSHQDRVEEVIEQIGFLEAVFRSDDEFNQELARRKVTPSIVDAFLKVLIPDPPETKRNRAKAKRELLEELLREGAGSDIQIDSATKVRDTLYGLRQAVSEYTNHKKQTRKSRDREAMELRFASTMFGAGRSFIDSADEILKVILDKDLVPEAQATQIDALELMEELTI